MHKTKTRSRYRLGRRPGQQGPRPQSSNQDWVGKLDTGREGEEEEKEELQGSEQQSMKLAKEEFTIGT